MDQITAKRHMVFGAIIWAAGMVLIFGSYAAGSTNTTDGRYIVAWLAMIFGASRFLSGLVKLTSRKRR